MPSRQDHSNRRRQAVKIEPWARWVAGFLGMAGIGSGGAAVFITHLEAGPVALIAGGVLFTFTSLGGVMPTRLKIGDNEAEWQQEIEEWVERIEREVPEVGALLDSSGASLEAISYGRSPEPGPNLAQAGVKVGSLAEEVRALEEKAGRDVVPAEAFLEIGRWYLAQRDWEEGARYLSEYVKRMKASWEVYFSLGVAYANMRQGERSDREALRAYDQAIALLPPDISADQRARLYSYRSAIKKRLGLLSEAKADAEMAMQLAEQRYELIDATYNLACIEAMLGNRDAALDQIRELSRLGATNLVLVHLDDYFNSLVEDPEFRQLVGLTKN
jgi:tetratricopeptide (TPR) repeat protein